MRCLFCDQEFEHDDSPELFVRLIEHAEKKHPDQADLLRDMWEMDLDEAKEAVRTDTVQDQ